MSLQTEGYKDKSPYKKRSKIKINSNQITMAGVSIPVLAIPDGDKPVVMQPGQEYLFPNSKSVTEYKMKKGGQQKHPFESYLESLSEQEQDNLVDYMDTLPESEQQQYMAKLLKGGCLECGGEMEMKMKKGGWLKDAVNPKHKGYCTPMSKPTCTGHRRAFALMMKKKHGFHQDGGEVYPQTPTNMANVEVEGQESVLLPNGQLREFEGPSHAQGGIPTNLPPGSQIFSEFLKVPPELIKSLTGRTSKKPISYADLSKKFSTKKFEDILKNPQADEYERNTAQTKLSTNNAALQTIFDTQEAVKQKENKNNEYQTGGQIGPNQSVLDRLNHFGVMPQNGNFPIYLQRGYSATDDQKNNQSYLDPFQIQSAGFAVPNEDFSFPQIHTEPSPTVSTGVVLPPPPMSAEQLSTTNYKQGPETFGEQRNYQPSTDTPKITIPKGVSRRSVTKSSVNPLTTKVEKRPTITNFDQLGQVGWSPYQVTSQRGAPPLPNMNDSQDDKSYPGDQPVATDTKTKKPWDFNVSSKVTGTIADILLAMSDTLKVENPTYYDQRKYPLFSRFVDVDNKDAERSLSLAIKQVQDSDMPEQIKQTRISQLNSQYQDARANQDLVNTQRYSQKIDQDINKLQSYTDSNKDQHRQDVENYIERKSKVDYLRDQFNAQRKSRIVNSTRNFFDYVDNTNLQSQLSDNYKVNPWSGKVQFKGSKQDPLKQQEDLLNQYQQNSSSRPLPNGATFTMIAPGVGIVTGTDGKSEIVHLNN